jgi:hypothetical protein
MFTYELLDRIKTFIINSTVFLDIVILLYDVFHTHGMNCTGLTVAAAFLSHSMCYHAFETHFYFK